MNLELEAGLAIEILQFKRLACHLINYPQHNLCGECSDCDRLHVEVVLWPVRELPQE
jgi:hypothetical protein